MLQSVLKIYGVNQFTGETIGSGLINKTWKIYCATGQFILQKINTAVFPHPDAIANNISLIADYLRSQHPDYVFTYPVKTLQGDEMVFLPEYGFFRMYQFLEGSYTVDVVRSVEMASEAAKNFAAFTGILSGFDARLLQETIPQFHNLSLRYKEFQLALLEGNMGRRQKVATLIEYLKSKEYILAHYHHIKALPDFKTRVMHHDTKISNILFRDNGGSPCVIDLDTVMPGLIISDIGDMMRTYLSPVDENERALDRISVREDYFEAIVRAYYGQLKMELSHEEKRSFVYAGMFMIYMQALRFLTDYLVNDRYYHCDYEGHNFVRASNQIALLKDYLLKRNLLERIAADIVNK